MPRVAGSLRYEGEGIGCGGGRWLMTSGARLPGEAILADDDLRETRIVPLKFMISLFAKRGLTPELSRTAAGVVNHARDREAVSA
jgi:hypothetical protein